MTIAQHPSKRHLVSLSPAMGGKQSLCRRHSHCRSAKPKAPTFSTLRTASMLALLCGCLYLGGCATRNGYVNHVMQPDLAPPAKESAESNKPMYLSLIRQMQEQGAYYASLANIEAFRQRYGSPPELSGLQADALRETGQLDAAGKIYQTLLNSNQAGAAWHGLGLIAAAQRQNDKAEQALSKAAQIDPVNANYLGDLGYQRLRAGQITAAHEPLAKAAELAPANVKAVSNLVVWMLLSGDEAQASAAMQRANLPEPAREQVRKLAIQLRAAPPPVAAPAAAAVAATTIAVVIPAAHKPQQVPPPQEQDALNAQQPSPPQIVGIPDSMLERFGSSSTPSEAHP